MSISIERYVSITSGVAGAQAVAQRELVGLRFSTSPRVPVDAQVVITSAADAADYFGASSDEYLFASQYFGYTSPAPASKAQRLRFAAHVNAARPARIYGADVATTLNEFKEITSGNLDLTVDGVTESITPVNLSAAATLADVASILTTSIDAKFTGSVVSYDPLLGEFSLTTATTGPADISVEQSQLATLLGWNSINAIFSPGASIQTPVESIIAANSDNDSFGSFSYGAPLSLPEIVSVAQYNASLNVKYMYLQGVSAAEAQAASAALIGIPSVGLVLNGTAGQFKEAIPQAIMAATNYMRRNAVVNYMYRQVPGMTSDVTSNEGANTYDPLRINYYGETANAGQKISFFQRAFLMGGANDPVDMNVHANEQWLKSYLQALLMSMQLSLGSLPANNDGRGYVLAQVTDAANQAKFNGTILMGKELSVAQQIAVTQITGDPDAWHDVQINGYWADAIVVQRTGESNLTEYEIQYTLVYSKGDAVRKITGSHNLI